MQNSKPQKNVPPQTPGASKPENKKGNKYPRPEKPSVGVNLGDEMKKLEPKKPEAPPPVREPEPEKFNPVKKAIKNIRERHKDLPQVVWDKINATKTSGEAKRALRDYLQSIEEV